MAEQRGAISKTRCQMEDFQRVLEDCCLSDLRFLGPKFAWNNEREGNAFTLERLDRAVANREWFHFFISAYVVVSAKCSLDHHPFLISFLKEEAEKRGKRDIFRVKESWKSYSDYREVVKKI